MIDVDAGDDRAVGIEGIDGVEAAAHADLEDHQIERGRGQQARDRQQGEFEVGQADVTARVLDSFEMRQQFGLGRPSSR